MSALPALTLPQPGWVLALSDRCYDRAPRLTAAERTALVELCRSPARWRTELSAAVARLTEPIDDVLAVVAPPAAWWGRYPARRAILGAMAARQEAFWAWDRERWLAVLGDSDPQIRQIVLALGYLLCEQRDLQLELRGFKARKFAGRVFGTEPVDAALNAIGSHVDAMGQAARLGRPNLQHALIDLMLLAASPRLEDLARCPERLAWLRSREQNNARRHGVEQLGRTLVAMGVLERLPFPAQASREDWLARSRAGERDVPEPWLAWIKRWFATSTVARRTRRRATSC